MLDKLGKIIEKKSWLVVGLILVITIGFSLLLPSLEMETSMDDFLPDNDVVNAEQRVSNYFEGNQQMLMIYVEKQKAEHAVTPEALKEEYLVLKEFKKIDQIEGSVSIAGFIDIICQMEFGKSLLNCSDVEINLW